MAKVTSCCSSAGVLAIGGLPFVVLKTRSLINVAAKDADAAPDFSLRIRVGLPGSESRKPKRRRLARDARTCFSETRALIVVRLLEAMDADLQISST
jgi:hypothetical protein